MNIARILAIGLLFGGGLLLSGMTDPARVIGFLDWSGQWDPSLAFVMGGAIASAAPLFALARRRTRPLFAEAFERDAEDTIDARLVTGAAIFGIGWGLAGICPGPALVLIGLDPIAIAPFIAALAVGFILSLPVGAYGRKPPSSTTRNRS
jgi:uncharacterized membrane protein YedE/YeeE